MTVQTEREAPMTDAEIEHLKSWLTLTLSGAMHYRHEVSREALEECLRAIDTLQARSQPSAPALSVEAIEAAIKTMEAELSNAELSINSDVARRKYAAHIEALRALLPTQGDKA